MVLLFSVSVHESAHALAAHRLGDDTAFREGRVSLNPLVHIDLLGTVIIPIMLIAWGGILLGWAKPTPYNPGNFRRDVSLSRGHITVAAAGPLSNLLLAVLFAAGFFVIRHMGLDLASGNPVFAFFFIGVTLNVVLALFNLLPLPPLDGSKVASWGLPREAAMRYDAVMERWGIWILLILFATGVLDMILSPALAVVVTVLRFLAR